MKIIINFIFITALISFLFPQVEANDYNGSKNTKLDELIQEFEDLKSKLLSKEQFDYTKERNVFNDIINKLSGFFKLRDYGDNNSPRSLITKAEISALNGDLKSVLYYLEKLPDDWKVGLKNFISKCKLFLAKENG